MNGEAIMSVSAAVVTCVQLLKWAILPDRYGPVAVLGLSLIGCAFWGWSTGDVSQASAFGYFAGWAAVSTSAAGVFGFTRATAEGIVRAMPPPSGAGASRTRTKKQKTDAP